MSILTMEQIDLFNSNNGTHMNFDKLVLNKDEDGSIYLTARASQDYLDYKDGGLAVALLDEASLDFIIAGEDGCINNFDMYSPIYNVWMDLMFLIPYSTSEEFMRGYEVNVYAREPEEDDGEYMLREYEFDIGERPVPDNY